MFLCDLQPFCLYLEAWSLDCYCIARSSQDSRAFIDLDRRLLIIHRFPFFFFFFGPVDAPGVFVRYREACSTSNADLFRRKSSIVALASSILECSPPCISTPRTSFASFFKLGVFPALYFLYPENFDVSLISLLGCPRNIRL